MGRSIQLLQETDLRRYYRVMEAHGIEVTEGYIKSARYLETEGGRRENKRAP